MLGSGLQVANEVSEQKLPLAYIPHPHVGLSLEWEERPLLIIPFQGNSAVGVW